MLHEWGLTPEYILNNWTEPELNLMIEKLTERLKPIKGRPEPVAKKVSDEAFFAQSSRLGKRRVSSVD